MPRRLPVISVPINFDFSHLLAMVEAWACGIWRASASNMEMACSAVVTALPKGVFITTTPALVAALKSTLSTPIPARPTTFSLSAFASNSGVTLVAERIASPSYSPIISPSSSGLRPGLKSTSIPASLKISIASGASLSLINTFIIFFSSYFFSSARTSPNAQSSHGIRAAISSASTVGPPQTRNPGGAVR